MKKQFLSTILEENRSSLIDRELKYPRTGNTRAGRHDTTKNAERKGWLSDGIQEGLLRERRPEPYVTD